MHKLGLADAGRTQEQEGAERPVRVLQPGARAPHGIADRGDRLVLADHPRVQLALHLEQLVALALEHAVDRHPGPARDDLRDVALGHVLLHHVLGLGLLGLGEPRLELGDPAVGDLAGTRQIAAALRHLELVAQAVELLLQLLAFGVLLLLRLPLRGELGRALLELGKLLLELGQAVLGGLVGLLLERLALDLELDDAAVELVDRLGLGIDHHALARRRLVDQVDRLVRQKPVGDVAVAERRRGDDRAVGDAHLVVAIVGVLEAAQDRDGVRDAGLGDVDRLKAPRQRRVLLDVLAVLVERRGADAVQLAARERGLEHVGGVHRAFRLAGADQVVQLVDEQDDVALAVRHLLQQSLQALLELAAILGARHQRAQVEREQPAIPQTVRHVAIDDPLRQALGDRGLADAGLADQHRVVLGAPGEHLDHAADLVVAADHRVELALAAGLGEVARVFLERIVALLGRGGIRRAALADLLDRGVQRLRRDPGVLQRLARIGAGRHRQRQQQTLDRDVAVAGLLGDLFGLLEQPCGLGRQIELTGTAALDLGQLGQRCLGRIQRPLRIAACRPDQVAGKPLGIVQQHLQKVFRHETLMAAAQRQALRRLDEPARPLGVFLEVHAQLPWPLRPLRPLVIGGHPRRPERGTGRPPMWAPAAAAQDLGSSDPAHAA